VSLFKSYGAIRQEGREALVNEKLGKGMSTSPGPRTFTTHGKVDIEGFESSFRRLFGQAYAAAYRVLWDQSDAEDAAAEALARALVSWPKLARATYVDAWVVRVAVNCSLDVLRGRTRSQSPHDSPPREAPQDRVLDRAIASDLLRRLPRRQREVLVLRYIGDFSEEEVAACLGVSPGAVKVHAHRGLARLRVLFEK
jgi:RNA polymerase sigma factor (sigma-70 family)